MILPFFSGIFFDACFGLILQSLQILHHNYKVKRKLIDSIIRVFKATSLKKYLRVPIINYEKNM